MRSFVVAFTILTTIAVPMSASAANPRPFTIPAPREWKGASGSYVLPKEPRIVAPLRLSGVARTFAADIHGTTSRRTGDIRLALVTTGPGGEGYTLSIARHGVRIAARTPTGVFWGTRTLL